MGGISGKGLIVVPDKFSWDRIASNEIRYIGAEFYQAVINITPDNINSFDYTIQVPAGLGWWERARLRARIDIQALSAVNDYHNGELLITSTKVSERIPWQEIQTPSVPVNKFVATITRDFWVNRESTTMTGTKPAITYKMNWSSGNINAVIATIGVIGFSV